MKKKNFKFLILFVFFFDQKIKSKIELIQKINNSWNKLKNNQKNISKIYFLVLTTGLLYFRKDIINYYKNINNIKIKINKEFIKFNEDFYKILNEKREIVSSYNIFNIFKNDDVQKLECLKKSVEGFIENENFIYLAYNALGFFGVDQFEKKMSNLFFRIDIFLKLLTCIKNKKSDESININLNQYKKQYKNDLKFINLYENFYSALNLALENKKIINPKYGEMQNNDNCEVQ